MTSFTFFLFFIPVLAVLLLAINFLFAPYNPNAEKRTAFECGFHSFLGQNRSQFSISFFIFALLFLLFDLEILLIYPYALSSNWNGIFGLVVMLLFFLLLTIGFIFELGKKALTIYSRQYKSSHSVSRRPVKCIKKSEISKVHFILSWALLDLSKIEFDWFNTFISYIKDILWRLAYSGDLDIVPGSGIGTDIDYGIRIVIGIAGSVALWYLLRNFNIRNRNTISVHLTSSFISNKANKPVEGNDKGVNAVIAKENQKGFFALYLPRILGGPLSSFLIYWITGVTVAIGDTSQKRLRSEFLAERDMPMTIEQIAATRGMILPWVPAPHPVWWAFLEKYFNFSVTTGAGDLVVILRPSDAVLREDGKYYIPLIVPRSEYYSEYKPLGL